MIDNPEVLARLSVRSDDVFASLPSQLVLDLIRNGEAVFGVLERMVLDEQLPQAQILRAISALGHCCRHAPLERELRLQTVLAHLALDHRKAVRSRAAHRSVAALEVNANRMRNDPARWSEALADVLSLARGALDLGVDQQADAAIRAFLGKHGT